MAIDFVAASSQCVDCGTSPGSASELSLSFWATPRQLIGQRPLDKFPLLGTVGWSVEFRSGGHIFFRIGSADNNGRATAGDVYTAGTRLHAVCTFGSSTAKIYVDGVLIDTQAGITQTPNDIATAFRVGIPSVSGTGDKFDGPIEDVRVYDTALTADEAAEIYAAQGIDMNMRILPHLVMRLPMRGQDGVVSGTVKDFSENGYDGTPTNSPKYAPGLVRLVRP